MNRESGRNQLGLARLEQQRLLHARAQIQSGAALRGVARQRKFAAEPHIENPDAQGPSRRSVHQPRDSRAGATGAAVAPSRERSRKRSMITPVSAFASSDLLALGSSMRAPPRASTSSALQSLSKALVCPTSFAAIKSRFFARSLARACCSTE